MDPDHNRDPAPLVGGRQRRRATAAPGATEPPQPRWIGHRLGDILAEPRGEHALHCPISFNIIPEAHVARLFSPDGLHDWHFDARHLNLWVFRHHTNPLTRAPTELSDIVEACPEFLTDLRAWWAAHPGHEAGPPPPIPAGNTLEFAQFKLFIVHLMRPLPPAIIRMLRAHMFEVNALRARGQLRSASVELVDRFARVLGYARVNASIRFVHSIWAPAPRAPPAAAAAGAWSRRLRQRRN